MVIKYSSSESLLAAASCPRTIAMDVCNNFRLPPHILQPTTHLHYQPRSPATHYYVNRLTGSTLELLSEHKQLHLVVDGQDTSTGDTTKNVGTSTLEERLDSLLGDNLLTSIE